MKPETILKKNLEIYPTDFLKNNYSKYNFKCGYITKIKTGSVYIRVHDSTHYLNNREISCFYTNFNKYFHIENKIPILNI